MMENILVRKAEPRDISNLAVLKQQVWIDTYATEGIRREFSDYVLSEFTPDTIQKTLEDAGMVILIVEHHEHLIGCAQIGLYQPCPIPSVAEPELMVLYVLERFCGMGIGSRLLAEVERVVKEKGYHGMWLTVYHRNDRAIRFYKKQNFTIIGSTDFEMGNNRYENTIMLKEPL